MNLYTGYVTPYNLESSSNNGASSSSPFNSNTEVSSDQDDTKTSHMIRWKSGKKLDPRLLSVLEQFGEIYDERHELFNKIFHGEHEEVFRKIGNALKKKKSMKKSGSMKRSMSMRAISSRQRGIFNQQESKTASNHDQLRPQRFKIRTPNVIEAAEDDAGQGDQTTKGSK